MNKEDIKLTIKPRTLRNGKTILVVVNDENYRALVAANRQDYERRLARNKSCRANIFGKI